MGIVGAVARITDIVRHHDPDPDHDPLVNGPPPAETVEIVAYDAQWPNRFLEIAAAIRSVMSTRALAIDHVGSTAVPGLAAKNIIDMDLTVADAADEKTYVPALTSIGYALIVREPRWHQHRCLHLQSPRANLHVFGPDCPENIRHKMFRDWLTTNAADRATYENAKRAAALGGGSVMDYNFRKSAVIRQIYDRLFRAAGML